MMSIPTIKIVRASGIGLVAFTVAVCLVFAAPQSISPRDALWIIVNYGCVPNKLQNHDPKPCVSVDLDEGRERGFAVLKDVEGATQFFLVPTARISGIESPILSATNAPNYFAYAWEARTNINEELHKTLPRDDIGLAVNSIASRSQDQLHIHNRLYSARCA